MNFILPNIDPVAFALGPVVVRWYALAYLAGFVLGWRYALMLIKRVPGERPNMDDIDNFLSWAIIGVILGGRLGYVLFYNMDYYLGEPLEALKIWHGGMSFHGGVLGLVAALFLFSKRNKINVFTLSDIICAAAPIGLFFGRIANFINAELYGRVTSLPWGVVFPDAGDLPRHPSQLYEAAAEGILLFIILYFVSKRKNVRIGMISALFLILYGLIRGIIEFVREPDAQIGLIGDIITMGQVLCIPMILAGIVLFFLAKKDKLAGDKTTLPK
ncbi:MAG: prolipoprotein diacylglyceryl transferase [Alphaproteobacteria bacterium]|nr:prolipoprotein diacylglyceryl transferase [Alphaproteobacteria bacterium]